MKTTGFWGIAVFFVLAFLAVEGRGQILLNELDVNPGGIDDGCEYVELIGPPGAAVENIHFVSLEGDTNKGQATAVISFGVPGPVIGSNGLLVVVSAAGCAPRTYPSGTTVITTAFLNTGVLQNGSNSFLLISSVTPITPNTDYDTNDDGTLDALPSGATIIDGVAWLDGGATDVVYGSAVLTAQNSTAANVIGAATRFLGDTRPNLAGAWYAGQRTGATPGDTTYSATVRTLNFPAGGALTPGAPNIGTTPRDAPVDINGDGRTDYVVVRAAGGAGSQLTWFSQFNGGSPSSPRDWGVSGDQILMGDYDGDGSDDIAVFRPSNGTFYILHTATQTLRIEQFGQAGDDARVVGDYDGDGRDDLAVYRPGVQSRWYYRTAPNAQFVTVDWGQTGDFLVPGDYDGDGRADFAVKRDSVALSNFYIRLATGELGVSEFGKGEVCPGDYDADGKTDLCLVDTTSSVYTWVVKPSNTPSSQNIVDTWGVTGDVPVLGDFTGDGKADYAVWRPGSPGVFYVMTVQERAIFTKQWGQTGDSPVARNAGP